MTPVSTLLSWKKHLHRTYPLLAAGTTQVFAVGTFMLAMRWLLPAELGSWAMFLTLVSFMEMARLGLVQSAVVHFLAHCPTEDRSYLKIAALLICLGASLAGALLLAILGSLFNLIWHLPGLVDLLIWFPLVALFTAPLRWHDAVRTAVQDFRGVFWAALVYGGSYLVFLLVTRYFGSGITPIWLLWGQVPAAGLTILFRRKTLMRELDLANPSRLQRDKLLVWLQKIWQFGRFGLGSGLSSMFFQRADVLLLGAFVSPAGLAMYNVATRIVTWLDFPLNALSQAYFPKIAAENVRSGPSGVLALYNRSVKTLLLYALPLSIGAFFGADLIVRLLAGTALPEAAHLLRILLLANVAKPFSRMLGVLLDATGRPALNFHIVLMSLGLNLLLLVCLLPAFGSIGAAVAGTLGIFLTTIGGQFFLRRSKMWRQDHAPQLEEV